jgi:hypothetical protein
MGVSIELHSPGRVPEFKSYVLSADLDMRMSTRELQAVFDSYLLLGRSVAVKPAWIDNQ